MDWTKLFFQIINLAVMLLILYRLFFKSVLRALDKRSTTVTSTLDDAERRTREAIDTFAESQERLSKIKERIAVVSEEADEELWRTRTHVLAETRHEIGTMREQAERGIKEAHQKGIYEYQCRLGRLVTTLSGRLVREAGGDSFQEACMRQFLEQLSMLPADDYCYVSAADEEPVVPVRLFSAYVLSAANRVQLEEQAQKMAGRPIKVVCKVDPALVAGAAMYIGDTVIDGSVAGSLHGLYDRYVADLHTIDQSMNDLTL